MLKLFKRTLVTGRVIPNKINIISPEFKQNTEKMNSLIQDLNAKSKSFYLKSQLLTSRDNQIGRRRPR